MALPTITRGIGFREDWLSSTGAYTWTLDSGVTITSDGDNATISSMDATHGATANTGLTGSSSPATSGNFTQLIVRAYQIGSPTSFDVRITYNDSATDTFTIPLTSGARTVANFTLTPGKNLNASTIKLLNAVPAFATVGVDFVSVYRELLTLPTAIRPLQEQDVSIMPVLPVLGRQGGIVQYIGAMNPRYTVSGGLVNTTSGQSGWTNTYTADQWWQILKGVWIEQNTIQADGNPTWQWFQSDNIQGKVLLQYGPQQVPGRIAYHDYVLSLVEFDVNGLTTANLPGITY